MAVFDATTLMCFLRKDCPLPIDPETQEPVTFARERIQHLVKSLQDKKETIIIPAPALAEAIARSGGARQQHLKIIQKSKWFKIVPFGAREALEHALMVDALGLQCVPGMSRPLVKFDMQILAIAQTESQRSIYSDDNGLIKIAEQIGGIHVTRTHELPLPPKLQIQDPHYDQESLFGPFDPDAI